MDPINKFSIAGNTSIGMAEMWGSDMDSIAQSGMIWANKMKISCIAPSAAAAGVVKYVSVPLGSLYDNGNRSSVTIRKLMAHVDSQEKFRGTVTLKNATVEPGLVSRVNSLKDFQSTYMG